jgi:hypothetical protein
MKAFIHFSINTLPSLGNFTGRDKSAYGGHNAAGQIKQSTPYRRTKI